MGNSVLAAFSDEQVSHLTGLRIGQLQYWDRTDFFRPSISRGGDGFGAVYSFADLRGLRILAVLRNTHGISVQHLRDVKKRLAEPGRNIWTGVKLYVLNKRVVWVEPGTNLPQQVASRQYVIPAIDLEEVMSKLPDEVRRLGARSSEQVGHVEVRRLVSQSAPVIAGTRIPVKVIKSFHQAGYSVQQILKEYPDLTAEDVRAALEYKKAA